MVKNLPAKQEMQVRSSHQEDPLEKEMALQCSWIEDPGGLQSMGSKRGRHDLATKQHQQVFVDAQAFL